MTRRRNSWGAKFKKAKVEVILDVPHYGNNNPYVGSEDAFQKTVAEILDMDLRTKNFWAHVPNGGRRTAKEGAKMKRMGTKPGVPDCLVFRKSDIHPGLAIELKVISSRGNVGSLSGYQKEWLSNLQKEGWFCCVAWSIDGIYKALDNYFSK